VNKAWFRDLEVELICGAQYSVVVLWCNCRIGEKHLLISAFVNPATVTSPFGITSHSLRNATQGISTNLFKVPSQHRNFLHTYLISNNTNLRTVSKIWVPLFLVSMDHRVLDTQLHTRFAIFLYALRLETAMLTKHVPLDAADAERFVLLQANTCLQVQRWPTRDLSNFYTDQQSAH
jgi:hypothetical protein